MDEDNGLHEQEDLAWTAPDQGGMYLRVSLTGQFSLATDLRDGAAHVLALPQEAALHHLREAIGAWAVHGQARGGAVPLAAATPRDRLPLPQALETRLLAYTLHHKLHPDRRPVGSRELAVEAVRDYRNAAGEQMLLTSPAWQEVTLRATERSYVLTGTRRPERPTLRAHVEVPARLMYEAIGWAYQVGWRGGQRILPAECALPRELADRIAAAWRARDPEHALPISTPLLSACLDLDRLARSDDTAALWRERGAAPALRAACQPRLITPPDERVYRRAFLMLGIERPEERADGPFPHGRPVFDW